MKDLVLALAVGVGILAAFRFATLEREWDRQAAARACRASSEIGRWGCISDWYESRGKEVPYAAIRAEDRARVAESMRGPKTPRQLLP